MSVTMSIKGDRELVATLTRFKNSAQRRMARAATRKALSPINKAAKANLKPHKRWGQLERSLGVVMVKASKTRIPGGVVGHVKPRSGYRVIRGGKAVDPVNYSHLVEGGIKAHAIKAKNRKALSFEYRDEFVAARSVRHPGFAGFGFMRRAFASKGREAVRVFQAEVVKQIPKEIARARRGSR